MRRVLVVGWLLIVGSAAVASFFYRDALERAMGDALVGPLALAGAVYLLLGALRGFTLIPATYLVVVAVPVFPPGWLLGLTLAGILMSSACVYRFADAMRLEAVFERRYPQRVAQLRAALARFELPVIIAWSFFPLAPTDLIVYVCGALRVDLKKCLLGVAIGEGAICAVYIFLGDYLLRVLGTR